MMDTQRLRFKGINGVEFPKWKKTSIEDLFDVSAGGDLDKDHFSHFKDDKHVYPIYANALTNGGLFGYSTKYTVAEKSITVTGRGEVGHATARDGKYTPIVRLLVCKPKNNQNTKFFEEAINRTNIVIESTGVPQLTVPQLKRIILPVPSLPEQQKIADFLSTYDEQISIQRERVEALERRKKGLLQKVFSQEIRFKADDGKEFPKWDEIPFCKAFSSISNNTLSRSELSFDVKTSVRNIHYGDVLIKYGAVIHTNIDTIPYVIEIEDKLTKEKLLKSGDVIFADTAEDNTVGKACELVLDDDSDSIVAGLHTIAVRPNEAFAFGYLGYFFNSTLFHDQLLPLIQGIKVSSISKRALFSETKVFYPSLPEQRKIADFFTAIDDQINIEKERLATMETIKKGLLQGLFC